VLVLMAVVVLMVVVRRTPQNRLELG